MFVESMSNLKRWKMYFVSDNFISFKFKNSKLDVLNYQSFIETYFKRSVFTVVYAKHSYHHYSFVTKFTALYQTLVTQ